MFGDIVKTEKCSDRLSISHINGLSGLSGSNWPSLLFAIYSLLYNNVTSVYIFIGCSP